MRLLASGTDKEQVINAVSPIVRWKIAMYACTLRTSAGGYHLRPISTVSERKRKKFIIAT